MEKKNKIYLDNLYETFQGIFEKCGIDVECVNVKFPDWWKIRCITKTYTSEWELVTEPSEAWSFYKYILDEFVEPTMLTETIEVE